MRRILLALTVAVLGLAPAIKYVHAQGTAFGIAPTFSGSISVTNTSSRLQLGANGNTVLLQNTGSVDAFVAFGSATVTATTATAGTSHSLPAGKCIAYNTAPSNYVAAITAASTTTIKVTQGIGALTCGGGAGAGTVGNVAITAPIGQTTDALGVSVTLPADQVIAQESGRVPVNTISGQAGVAGNTGGVGATTQRVTLATDVALPAGQAKIGNVGSITNTVCVTPTVTNATYAANVVVGGLLTFSNLFTSTGSGAIQSVSVNFTTAQTVGFTLYPFGATPTNASTWTDHGVAAISGATDIFLTRPPITLTNAYSGLGTMTNYSAAGLGQSYSTGGTSGFFILVPNNTTAALGGTASVVQVCVTVLQDS